MVNPVIDAANRLFSSTWVMLLGGLVALMYLAALMWKILNAEEGFLFGYGNWIIGKWQRMRYHSHGYQPVERAVRPKPKPGSPTPVLRKQRTPAAMDRDLQTQANVLRLSRVLDGDLAYLMMNDIEDWEPKIMRGLQMLVSGVTRVVHPAGRVRCGFFILDEDQQNLTLGVGEGYSGLKRPRLSVEHSCAGRSFTTGENYYCRDVATDPVYWHSAQKRLDFRSIACTPVRTGNVIFGVLCLDAQEPGAFTPEDFLHLELFAAKLAVFCAFHTLQQTGVCGFRPE